MAGFNYARTLATSDRLIARHGGRHVLRRDGIDRDCLAMEAQWSAAERSTLKNIADRVFLVSVTDLPEPPDMRLDSLVAFVPPGYTVESEVLRIVAPPNPVPSLAHVVHWELTVRRA